MMSALIVFFHALTLISVDKLEAGSSYFYPSLKKKNLWMLGQKKICVFTVACQKNLGSVGRDFVCLL